MPLTSQRAATIDCEPPQPATTMLPAASFAMAVAPLFWALPLGVPANCWVTKPLTPNVVSSEPSWL